MKRSIICEIPQISKKHKSQGKSTELLCNFITWCDKNKLTVNNKVKACLENTCAQNGMIATSDVNSGECLFEIPRDLLLTPQTCSISEVLQQESESLTSDSGWVPLLIALMYEYVNPESKWKPYLSAFPDFTELDLPMFWDSEDRNKELLGTGVPESVDKDLKNIEVEFNTVVLPFVKKHSKIFTDSRCTDIEFYRKMVAFVMSYSFTEPIRSQTDGDDSDEEELLGGEKSPPMMVPMADLLNHVAKNNAHLDFGKESLKMVAVRDIKQGEEVYNTYGELSNFQLLHMYGFAEAYPNNFYDTVEISMSKVEKFLQGTDLVDDSFRDRWTILQQSNVISPDGAIVIGEEGILSEEEMLEMLKVLTMQSDRLEQYKQNDGWVEDDDDDLSLLKDDLKFLPQKWQDIIKHVTTNALKEYGDRTLEREEESLHPDKWSKLDRRQQFSVYVRYGQLKLLHELLQSMNKLEDTNKRTT